MVIKEVALFQMHSQIQNNFIYLDDRKMDISSARSFSIPVR